MPGRRTPAIGPAMLVLALIAATPAAAVDLSGDYVGQVDVPFTVSCTLTFAQAGASLTIDGPCTFGTDAYTFDLAGTVDPLTGEFNTSGVLLGLCETPGSVTIVGTGDGDVFSGTAVCDTIVSPVTGTKCGNGVVDAAEDCEDGNTAAGDCCSPACLFDPPGTACTADLDSCTLDQCDGAGQCQHPSAPPGTTCTDDGNECTDDVCDAGAACTHPANTGPCDDGNACTTADACATGSCVGGPIAPECAGALDLSGAWELVGPPPDPTALPGHTGGTTSCLDAEFADPSVSTPSRFRATD